MIGTAVALLSVPLHQAVKGTEAQARLPQGLRLVLLAPVHAFEDSVCSPHETGMGARET